MFQYGMCALEVMFLKIRRLPPMGEAVSWWQGVYVFFLFFAGAANLSQALSFNRLNAQQLGERLLRWSGHYGQHYVDSQKVWKAKKKNKGQKRKDWWAAVKDYHNQGGTDGQDQDGQDPDHNKPHGGDGLDGTPPIAAPVDKSPMPPVQWDFSGAPWNKKPRVEVVDDDDETTKTGGGADHKKEKEDGKSSSSKPGLKVRIFGP